mmetsp:Transcript_12755/g.21525  ORF Transcript_12755/g.21525 Transcript_12755/m.21525 type:complete len:207 (-) Transcript_12755:582-1202(-)
MALAAVEAFKEGAVLLFALLEKLVEASSETRLVLPLKDAGSGGLGGLRGLGLLEVEAIGDLVFGLVCKLAICGGRFLGVLETLDNLLDLPDHALVALLDHFVDVEVGLALLKEAGEGDGVPVPAEEDVSLLAALADVEQLTLDEDALLGGRALLEGLLDVAEEGVGAEHDELFELVGAEGLGEEPAEGDQNIEKVDILRPIIQEVS